LLYILGGISLGGNFPRRGAGASRQQQPLKGWCPGRRVEPSTSKGDSACRAKKRLGVEVWERKDDKGYYFHHSTVIVEPELLNQSAARHNSEGTKFDKRADKKSIS
jgi:hypothetical protein